MDSSLRDGAHRLWTTVQSTAAGTAPIAKFLADWPAVPHESAELPGEPLPVLRWLPQISARAAPFGENFVKLLCGASGSLHWRQTYMLSQVGGRFLDNYGWAELLRPGETTGAIQISCGVLVLGPNTFYPPHRHEAEEIYLPLAGTAEWQQGEPDAASWRRRSPGSLIHHSSEEPHAMRTGEEPLLAMYLWRSADLRRGARLDRGSAE
jgi:hypothetical protein